VDGHGGDPLGTRHQLLRQFLVKSGNLQC
jgi:hypothetical protein